MTEENVTPQATQEQPTMSLQKIYVKDVSFEAPNAPDIYNQEGQPEIKMNLNQKVKQIQDGLFEVELAVTVTCNLQEKTAYLVEVQQAGIFALKNFPDNVLHQTLGSYCPNVLFPYARQLVSELVSSGGFQPLLLQPVNFEQLYTEQVQKAQQQAETSTKQ